jgi:hypothetical protein
VVRATEHGHAQVRERLAGMHERMQETAEQVSEGARREAAAFLRGIAQVLEAESTSAAPLSPAAPPSPPSSPSSPASPAS